MKKLKDVIPSTAGLRDSGTGPELSHKRATRVWTALAEMFGNVFFNQFGMDPPSVWIRQVQRRSDDEIRRGLTNIAESDRAYPPNLPQFVAACKALPPVRHLGVKQIEDDRPKGKLSYAQWKKQNDM